jgi:hypothetical protein
MIFKKKEEKLEPYSVDQCFNCNKSTKRKFSQGDYVFKMIQKCTSCGTGSVIISKIFSEPVK